MIALSVGEIAAIVGGRLAGADPQAVVRAGVEFDSRRIEPGGLFLAFAGEQVDGHDFVGAAVARGAVAAVVTRAVDGPCIVVTDALAAISALASAVARRLTATVVAVTGSSGKTSTKDLVASLLTRLGPTVAPPGSYNNELGHPYTVLLADERTRYLVLEVSARGLGHIRSLCAIAPPQIGVVLNVGSAHLGEFGSREVIAQAKGELVEALSASGVAVLNADDPLVLGMAERTAARVVTVGEAAAADVRATDAVLDERGRASFTLHARGGTADVRLRLAGAHHVGNALAATAVALECGLPLAEIAAALSEAGTVSRWRMEITERGDGVLVVNDAYNANPESMRAALETLAAIARARRGAGARSFAVLGPMAELGAQGLAEHDGIGRLAARLDISFVIAVGEQARPIQRGAAAEGSTGGPWDGEARWVPDAEAAVSMLRAELRPGDVVLVKASRAASLERVALAIAEDDASGTDRTGGGAA